MPTSTDAMVRMACEYAALEVFEDRPDAPVMAQFFAALTRAKGLLISPPLGTVAKVLRDVFKDLGHPLPVL